jgi:hypothetical protein
MPRSRAHAAAEATCLEPSLQQTETNGLHASGRISARRLPPPGVRTTSYFKAFPYRSSDCRSAYLLKINSRMTNRIFVSLFVALVGALGGCSDSVENLEFGASCKSNAECSSGICEGAPYDPYAKCVKPCQTPDDCRPSNGSAAICTNIAGGRQCSFAAWNRSSCTLLRSGEWPVNGDRNTCSLTACELDTQGCGCNACGADGDSRYCDTTTHECKPRKAEGESCEWDGDCITGSCVYPKDSSSKVCSMPLGVPCEAGRPCSYCRPVGNTTECTRSCHGTMPRSDAFFYSDCPSGFECGAVPPTLSIEREYFVCMAPCRATGCPDGTACHEAIPVKESYPKARTCY